MLYNLFKELNALIAEENIRRIKSDEGGPYIQPCHFFVLGQFALIEAKISQIATRDVDAKITADHWVKTEFSRLLRTQGLIWDAHSNEIKMPKETEYDELFKSENITAFVAQPEYVLISKAMYSPEKNRGVFEEYLAAGASEKFLKLAKLYKIDLEDLLRRE